MFNEEKILVLIHSDIATFLALLLTCDDLGVSQLVKGRRLILQKKIKLFRDYKFHLQIQYESNSVGDKVNCSYIIS